MPVNAAKFAMARDCAQQRLHRALIAIYKRLILGANSAIDDFRAGLLQACTGSLQVLLNLAV
jgi:hypothetical protein